MATTVSEKASLLGPYQPTLILHGGAGSISRATLPPELWSRYQASLLKYLTLTRELLDSGASALDAACYAVTLFEDDPLFNCGRGAVFTEQGTIELEASLMVCSIDPAGPPAGGIKRSAAVSLVQNTRHPILLAKEVLVAADDDGGLGQINTMHCHLSGRRLEEWGWNEKGLEKQPDQWFWTKERWEEHRRGLQKPDSYTFEDLLASEGSSSISFRQREREHEEETVGIADIPSQGTVGAVCLDSWGNLAVATSTGGLTNKKAGRIGDTPTVGAGFWAEGWEEAISPPTRHGHDLMPRISFHTQTRSVFNQTWAQLGHWVGPCLDAFDQSRDYQPLNGDPPAYTPMPTSPSQPYRSPSSLVCPSAHRSQRRRRAVAMSGTGNGDSFLRTNAVRTAAAMCRFSAATSLSEAVTAVAGPGGELQSSAGNRWDRTFEGQGGIIGIELVSDDLDADDDPSMYGASPESRNGRHRTDCKTRRKKRRGKVVFDFNCGGLFRAFFEVDEQGQREKPRAMVFKEEY
ncbi:hypothetical protein A1O3_02236 [Capronia epimyces CBS 606.96]|uniref:L-asparaginase n=1 Tax=Capronia epimyces CBS 606.96 TaxID=1182542 RepID=W9Y8I9_9EURO|nr:uncharacterized protein A1O3_02236 [Capronia epimyces CBS 606.96]EXJ89172.1 hypothetical protein A1O3_02236 [Capronia epimyces CBS 606.96]